MPKLVASKVACTKVAEQVRASLTVTSRIASTELAGQSGLDKHMSHEGRTAVEFRSHHRPTTSVTTLKETLKRVDSMPSGILPTLCITRKACKDACLLIEVATAVLWIWSIGDRYHGLASHATETSAPSTVVDFGPDQESNFATASVGLGAHFAKDGPLSRIQGRQLCQPMLMSRCR